MAGLRSEDARDRARDLLATVRPIPEDAEARRLCELAIDHIQEAERLEADNRGRAAESEELISAALDAVARDHFKRALLRAVSRRNAQVWLPDEAPTVQADSYEVVTCPACARRHLVNKTTGKMSGDNEK
jgi:hypothetical protein